MATDTEQKYDKANPYAAKLVINYTLNKEGSNKDTRHFSIDLGESGITYLPGDSLCVYPKNDPELVNNLLDVVDLSLSREEEFERFTNEVNITRPGNKLIKLIMERLDEFGAESFSSEEFGDKFHGDTVWGILRKLPDIKLSTNEIAENQAKLMARAYSIASSMNAHPGHVELCVARVEEEINGSKFYGVCSNYMSYRSPLNENDMKVYIHKNDRFRLPPEASTDIIMVGPGTGIAPFRSFIEERVHQKNNGESVGKNWLFFGDQKAACDYLYEDELKKYEADGELEITTAFSRDQEEKIYVQTRMKEHADKIYEWLKNGAYFYVCGDARRMAKDVDNMLKEILSANGEDADEYIKQMKADKRYCRDVY